ncbi:MAG: GlsB/YeaQ/YmgE family stress response membrane protein [Gemmatimonadota bacterium]|nr:GlsB/YeaQ/YmgE family stress response membrane protein [Gemmatimonadota bacterium]
MTLVGFLLLLLVAAIAGALGQALVGYSAGGCLVSIALGFVGALLGSWLAAQLGLPEPFPITIEGRPFPLIWSIVGASLFVALLSLIGGRRR